MCLAHYKPSSARTRSVHAIVLGGVFRVGARGRPDPVVPVRRWCWWQETGFKWAVSNLRNGFGAVFADDMGLGKTIQSIAVVLHLAPDNTLPTLVVAPSALLSNWEAELRRFAPSLRVHTFHGAGRSLARVPTGASGRSSSDSAAASGGSKRRRVADEAGFHVVLTSYGLVKRDEELARRRWSCVVIDESQTIKNPNAGVSKAVKSVASRCRYRIALSGTPVENCLSELWSVFDFAVVRATAALPGCTKQARLVVSRG